MLAAQVVDSVGQVGRIPMIRRWRIASALAVGMTAVRDPAGQPKTAGRGFEMGCEPGYAKASNRPLSSRKIGGGDG